MNWKWYLGNVSKARCAICGQLLGRGDNLIEVNERPAHLVCVLSTAPPPPALDDGTQPGWITQ